MHHHEFGGFSWFNSGFGVLIALVIVVWIIFVLISFIRRNATDVRDDDLNSYEVLKRRFASGEITAAEYEYMKKELGVEPDSMELLNRRYAQGLITSAEYEHIKKNLANTE
jgi:uncharacterized membrane protein